MKIAVKPADLDRDEEVLISTLQRYLTPAWDKNRFDWLYRQNPHGPARAWLAVDTESGEIVGTSAAFSRRATINGRRTFGYVLGDFCIADKCRSLGPALQLQRATLDASGDSEQAEFSFDFPSQKMTVLYKRLGVGATAHMVRMAKPLRVDRRFQSLPRQLAQPACWIGNLLLRISDYKPFSAQGFDVALHESSCGDEFTALWERLKSADGIEIVRSAEYLNWRYLRHPSVQHQILTARKGTELQGYLVFNCIGPDVQIAEWCVGNDWAVLEALVRDLVCRLRRARLVTLSAFLLHTDPRLPLLSKMGFWPRERCPLMVHWSRTDTKTKRGWLLMNGDRDS